MIGLIKVVLNYINISKFKKLNTWDSTNTRNRSNQSTIGKVYV
jgi:hypothetical protein